MEKNTNKNTNKNKNIDKIIKKYIEPVSLFEYYITQNIVKLVRIKKEYSFIRSNNYILSITNKLGNNSMNILLDNSQYDIIKELVRDDIRILNYKNTQEKNLLQSIIYCEDLYDLIIEFLNKISDKNIKNLDKFKINLIKSRDINGINFIDRSIEILKLNENINLTNTKTNIYKIVEILRLIYQLDKEEDFLIITSLCREISNEKTLLSILKHINPNHLDTYPDLDNNTCIDYLILNDKLEVLEYLVDRIEYIYFLNFEENSLLLFLDSIFEQQIDSNYKNLVKIIFKILSKSNINKLKDMYNENILIKLLKIFDFDIKTIKKYIAYFDIFEQNIDGENIYNMLKNKYKNNLNKILNKTYYVDSQIDTINTNNTINIVKINYNLDIKQFLKPINYGLFNADPLHNMIYTRIVLQHDNIIIPYYSQTESHFLNEKSYLSMSNNDIDIMTLIKTYFYNYNTWLPHLIIWKNLNNYFIHPKLIEWLISYSNQANAKRFVYIKLSLMATNNLQGSFRHANLILIDNYKKIIERFEPYGEVYFNDGIGLNEILKRELADKLNYTYNFVQSYPGFQIRSNEFDNKNKSYGDPGGYCLAWCFLYLELKVYYENNIIENIKNMSEIKENKDDMIIQIINNYIINRFVKDFPELKEDKQQNLYMTFIRYYANNLDNSKNKLLESYGLNLSTIYHIQLDTAVNIKIIKNVNKDLLEINRI